LLASQAGLTQKLIAAVVEVNRPRKDFIADQIIARHPKVVTIYRLVMKEDSDNFRQSSIHGITKRIKAKGVIDDEAAFYEDEFYLSRAVRGHQGRGESNRVEPAAP
jgi:UDPglucose 6-dehydrogenase